MKSPHNSQKQMCVCVCVCEVNTHNICIADHGFEY